MADIEKLVGSDGKLVTVLLDDEAVGDATATLDVLAGGAAASGAGAGWYTITAIAGASAFESELAVGDLFWDDGTLVMATGDKACHLIESEKADIGSFGIEITKAEIDVTTLSDNVKRYRAGKTDMTGNMEGITTLGETDSAGYIINNFIRVVRQAANGDVVINEIDDSPIYIKGVIQKTLAAGEQESFVWARINILSSSLGASGEDAQSFSSSFRIAPGNPDPTLYLRTVPVVE